MFCWFSVFYHICEGFIKVFPLWFCGNGATISPVRGCAQRILKGSANPFMQTLLLIAAALFAGLLMTRLFVKLRLPDVTA